MKPALSAGLILPPSSYALRVGTPAETSLEEDLTRAIGATTSTTAGLEERNKQFYDSLTTAVRGGDSETVQALVDDQRELALAGLEEAGLNSSDMVLTDFSLGGRPFLKGIASRGTPVVALASEMVPTLTLPELAGLEEAARRHGTVLNVNRMHRQYGDQLLLEAA